MRVSSKSPAPTEPSIRKLKLSRGGEARSGEAKAAKPNYLSKLRRLLGEMDYAETGIRPRKPFVS
jgi:hypothetical protein